MKKAFVFDFDDTLATTDCMVLVRTLGEVVHRLTPSEYNTHELNVGCEYDFSEFEKLINPQPLYVLNLAKEVYNEGHSVYVLTARGNAVADAIHNFMVIAGIKTKEVICVGDSPVNIADEKSKVLSVIIETHDRVYFYDDDTHNVNEAKKVGAISNLV
jgi:hypothetical protein